MFTPNSGAGEPRSLIPDKTLAFAQVRFQEIKKSQKTGGEYARLEFTIVDGPFEGRKVFSIVMNPKDAANGDVQAPTPNGAKMGLTALTRMLEACRIFDAAKPETYKRFDGATFAEILRELDTQTVAIKVKVVPAKDGYDEKNEISEYASPNPASGSIKLWQQLTGGEAAAQQARGSAFGSAPQQAPAAAPRNGASPGWLKSPGNAPF
jgi:hypothetical protein